MMEFSHVYAIVRFDEFHGDDVPIDRMVSVKAVLLNAESAAREVDRLNGLQAGGGVRYVYMLTRLENSKATT